MHLFRRIFLPLCIASLAGASMAQGQAHHEPTPEQLGGAAVWPYGTEKILQSAVDYCMTLGPNAAVPAAAALWGWRKRHETYLFLSAYYRMEIQKFAAAHPETPEMATLKKITTQDADDLAKAYSEALVLGFRKAQEADPRDGGANLCRNYFRSVEDGKMDLKNRNPEMAAIMDQDPVAQYYDKQSKKEK